MRFLVEAQLPIVLVRLLEQHGYEPQYVVMLKYKERQFIFIYVILFK